MIELDRVGAISQDEALLRRRSPDSRHQGDKKGANAGASQLQILVALGARSLLARLVAVKRFFNAALSM